MSRNATRANCIGKLYRIPRAKPIRDQQHRALLVYRPARPSARLLIYIWQAGRGKNNARAAHGSSLMFYMRPRNVFGNAIKIYIKQT